MAERPILFGGPMVRAILGGRKTQTRRVVKLPSDTHIEQHDLQRDTDYYVKCGLCPYGKIGDQLWVRENWAVSACYDYCKPSELTAVGMGPCIEYAAGGSSRCEKRRGGPFVFEDNRGRWRPSIYMPRWASRITLEITGIRVERVRDISEQDARAEGVPPYDDGAPMDWRWGFHMVWDSLNAKRGFSWDKNPWVWVIGFPRITEGRSDGK